MLRRSKLKLQENRTHGNPESPQKRHVGLASGGKTTLNTAVHRICSHVEKDPDAYPFYDFKVKYSTFPGVEVRIFRYLQHLFLGEGNGDAELDAYFDKHEDESDNEAIFRHFYRRVWKWNDDFSWALQAGLAKPLMREEFAESMIRIGSAMPHEASNGIEGLIVW